MFDKILLFVLSFFLSSYCFSQSPKNKSPKTHLKNISLTLKVKGSHMEEKLLFEAEKDSSIQFNPKNPFLCGYGVFLEKHNILKDDTYAFKDEFIVPLLIQKYKERVLLKLRGSERVFVTNAIKKGSKITEVLSQYNVGNEISLVANDHTSNNLELVKFNVGRVEEASKKYTVEKFGNKFEINPSLKHGTQYIRAIEVSKGLNLKKINNFLKKTTLVKGLDAIDISCTDMAFSRCGGDFSFINSSIVVFDRKLEGFFPTMAYPLNCEGDKDSYLDLRSVSYIGIDDLFVKEDEKFIEALSFFWETYINNQAVIDVHPDAASNPIVDFFSDLRAGDVKVSEHPFAIKIKDGKIGLETYNFPHVINNYNGIESSYFSYDEIKKFLNPWVSRDFSIKHGALNSKTEEKPGR